MTLIGLQNNVRDVIRLTGKRPMEAYVSERDFLDLLLLFELPLDSMSMFPRPEFPAVFGCAIKPRGDVRDGWIAYQAPKAQTVLPIHA